MGPRRSPLDDDNINSLTSLMLPAALLFLICSTSSVRQRVVVGDIMTGSSNRSRSYVWGGVAACFWLRVRGSDETGWTSGSAARAQLPSVLEPDDMEQLEAPLPVLANWPGSGLIRGWTSSAQLLVMMS